MRRLAAALSTFLVMLLCLAAVPAAAQPAPEKRPDHSYDRSQGLERRVFPDGFVDHSHGPDAHAPEEASVASTVPEFPPVCVGGNGRRFQVIYGHTTTPRFSAAMDIRTAVHKLNGVFRDNARQQGSNARFRFACDSQGEVSVLARRLPSCDDYTSIVQAVRGQGFTDSRAKYLIFCSDSNSPWAGQASIRGDDRDTVSNANNQGPSYAVVYNSDHSGYESRWGVALHELSHTLGAVQHSAPDSSGRWHCNGFRFEDIMCYDDGGPTWERNHSCSEDTRRYDRCTNDYFNPYPEAGSYLSTHWQVGSCHLHRRWAVYRHCL